MESEPQRTIPTGASVRRIAYMRPDTSILVSTPKFRNLEKGLPALKNRRNVENHTKDRDICPRFTRFAPIFLNGVLKTAVSTNCRFQNGVVSHAGCSADHRGSLQSHGLPTPRFEWKSGSGSAFVRCNRMIVLLTCVACSGSDRLLNDCVVPVIGTCLSTTVDSLLFPCY